jgi:hypothetical protein
MSVLDMIRDRHRMATERGGEDATSTAHYDRGYLLAEVDRLVRERSEMRDACIHIARVEADVMEESDMQCGGRIANHIRNVIDAIKKLP